MAGVHRRSHSCMGFTSGPPTSQSACADNGISWLEEPLDWHDYDGLAALKKASKVKIAGAELNHGWDEIKIMFEKDCLDIYQPDAVFAGGMAQVKKVIDACHEHDRTFSPHTWTNGIGFYMNWNMALADRKNSHPLEYPLEEPSWIPELREGIIDPILPNAERNASRPFRKPGSRFRNRQEESSASTASASSSSPRQASSSKSSAKKVLKDRPRTSRSEKTGTITRPENRPDLQRCGPHLVLEMMSVLEGEPVPRRHAARSAVARRATNPARMPAAQGGAKRRRGGRITVGVGGWDLDQSVGPAIPRLWAYVSLFVAAFGSRDARRIRSHKVPKAASHQGKKPA